MNPRTTRTYPIGQMDTVGESVTHDTTPTRQLTCRYRIGPKPFRTSQSLPRTSQRHASLSDPNYPTTSKIYDGLTDPDDHMGIFNQAGAVAGWPLPVWCHMFPQTLSGAARVWFDNLPTGKIDSYEELIEKVFLHFSQQRRHKRDKMQIHMCKRRDNESLEDFII